MPYTVRLKATDSLAPAGLLAWKAPGPTPPLRAGSRGLPLARPHATARARLLTGSTPRCSPPHAPPAALPQAPPCLPQLAGWAGAHGGANLCPAPCAPGRILRPAPRAPVRPGPHPGHEPGSPRLTFSIWYSTDRVSGRCALDSGLLEDVFFRTQQRRWILNIIDFLSGWAAVSRLSRGRVAVKRPGLMVRLCHHCEVCVCPSGLRLKCLRKQCGPCGTS